MRQTGWFGLALAAGMALAGCGGPGMEITPENRAGITEDMLESDTFASGYIGGGPGSIGSP